MSGVSIHPSAVLHPSARLGERIHIEAYAIVGERVTLGDDTVIMHHSVIEKNTDIGQKCQIFPFSSLGTNPQDITFSNEETFLRIGDNNLIREFVTINRGTAKGGFCTQIQNDNYLMAYVHIGHDCRIGSHCQLINGATLAGHVEVDDYAVVGAFSQVHQFVRIGRNSYIGASTLVPQDVLPFAKISQQRTKHFFYGPNSIGMMRNGFSREFIEKIKEIFRIIYMSDLNTSQAIEKIKTEFPENQESQVILDFITKTKRGLIKDFQFDE